MAEDIHIPDIRPLTMEDSRSLAELFSDYSQSRLRGPKQPADNFYAEKILSDKSSSEVLGAFDDNSLIGFCLFHAYDNPMLGLEAGSITHFYVSESHRGKGIGQALIDLVTEEARNRNWSDLHVVVPRLDGPGRRIAEKLGTASDTAQYTITL